MVIVNTREGKEVEKTWAQRLWKDVEREEKNDKLEKMKRNREGESKRKQNQELPKSTLSKRYQETNQRAPWTKDYIKEILGNQLPS